MEEASPQCEDNEEMVRTQIIDRGIENKRVVDAFLCVDRVDFTPVDADKNTYGDFPLSIGHSQTISQPYMVAIMTELLDLKGQEKVLEIGTGSGYQTAILSRLAREVYTAERIPQLATSAKEKLESLGYKNVYFKLGNGFEGWSEYAPYDSIIVTAAPSVMPCKLIDQLKIGGRLIIPIGDYLQPQTLYRITKTEKGINEEKFGLCSFVPLIDG